MLLCSDRELVYDDLVVLKLWCMYQLWPWLII